MNETQNTTGRVVSVNISEQKGTSKTSCPEIRIDECGVAGDAHAGPWHRQVSLLAVESIGRFAAEAERDFAHGDFAENITTRGLVLTDMTRLDRLSVGEAELEVTQIGKQCHGDGCAIFSQVGRCVMPKEGIFCRVVKGGVVKAGDEITHTRRSLRCRIITLSDRASGGVYADESGPRVHAAILAFCEKEKWNPVVELLLMPDDADRLRAALLESRNEGLDIVITTGGTGIGPRDITPDVVMSLADKLIPGIMEHIRMTSGAQKPSALISRSVAAVMGRTLVFTLPGSVRAVEEYMTEITKILEHAILMLKSVDAH